MDHCQSLSERIKSIAAFQTDEDVSILIIPLKIGSEGPKLGCASWILFVEPCYDKIAEDRAIGKVKRSSKGSHLRVVTFVTKETIEAYILDQRNTGKEVRLSEITKLKLKETLKNEIYGVKIKYRNSIVV